MTDPTVERTWERENTMETVWGEDAWLWSRRRSQVGGVYEAVVPFAVEEAIRADEATRWREAVSTALERWDECLPSISTAESVAYIHGWRYGGPDEGMKPVIDRLRSLLDPKDSR